MKIKEIKLNKFKRFSDLTITGIPETAKLILLVGPNGCGKTSIFEAFNHWYKNKAFYNRGEQNYYLKEGDKEFLNDSHWYDNRVKIEAYDFSSQNSEEIKGKYYFRSAHRNEPDFTTSQLTKLSNPRNVIRLNTLMDTDAGVSENYQRLVSNTLSGVFDDKNDDKTVKALRDELIGRIKLSLSHVLEDLELSSIGDPLLNGSFYFTKGRSKNFHYKNLSAGEKAAFDLILDLVIKTSYFNNTIFCIDEPEIHMHTSLQSKLLEEIYALVPNHSQLWLSTHSIGMLQKAKELEKENPGSVCFFDFSDIDFDNSITISPVKVDYAIWNKFLELTFADFAGLIAPTQVVFCEGNIKGKNTKSFDSQVYQRIFSRKYYDTSFVSVGSCNDLEKEENISINIINQLLKKSKVIKIIDRDNRSEEEIQELKYKGINVLNRRHLECYLLDDEIIGKLCAYVGKEDKIPLCLEAKQEAISKV